MRRSWSRRTWERRPAPPAEALLGPDGWWPRSGRIPAMATIDVHGARVPLPGVPGIDHYRLARLAETGAGDPSRLPVTVKVLLENLLRHAGERFVDDGDVEALARGDGRPPAQDSERAFVPA